MDRLKPNNTMRRTFYTLVTACTLVLSACNFSVGTNKDLVTGLSYSYNGFAVDEVLLVGPDNVAMSNNEVQLNTKVAIVVQGVTNYELQDGKAFPGLMLRLTDKTGNSILDEPDLFANSEGYSPTDAAILRGSVTVGEPMKSGETYHLKMRVWDKTKPENELTAEVDIAVK
jgi:hypothetical protein